MTEDELVIEWQKDNPRISFKSWLIDGINAAIAYKANEDRRIAAAVAAETERANEAEAFVNFIAQRYASDPYTREYKEAQETKRKIAAIRARNGNGGKGE